MQQFRVYMNKINGMIKSGEKKPKSKSSGGLLSPSRSMPKQDKKEQQGMEVVAEFVKGIRAAREGFKK